MTNDEKLPPVTSCADSHVLHLTARFCVGTCFDSCAAGVVRFLNKAIGVICLAIAIANPLDVPRLFSQEAADPNVADSQSGQTVSPQVSPSDSAGDGSKKEMANSQSFESNDFGADEMVWEYMPYRVQTWLAIDSQIPVDQAVIARLKTRIQNDLRIAFGPTWNHKLLDAPSQFQPAMLSNIEDFGIDQILASDSVLFVGKKQPDYSRVRDIEAALVRIDKIILPNDLSESFLKSVEQYASTDDDSWSQFRDKLEVSEATISELITQLEEDAPIAVLLPNQYVSKELKEFGRVVPLNAPWQMTNVINAMDKLLLVSLKLSDDGSYEMGFREVDCPLRWMSGTLHRSCSHWDFISRSMAAGLEKVFAPVGRMEKTGTKIVHFRMRAAGLIVDDAHPARVKRGDVMTPIIRQNDRSGNPLLIQDAPWTYVATIDGEENVKMRGITITNRRQILQGRQGKRSVRRLLKIEPLYERTDIRLVIQRSGGESLTGATMYQRVPNIKGVDYVGTSDWRGIYTAKMSLPPEIEYPLTDEEVARLSPEELEELTKPLAPPKPPQAKEGGEEGDTPAEDVQLPEPKPRIPKGKLQLNVPLYEYLVKNGGKVLAKMPVITGIKEKQIASIRDDRRRLEAEAFLKGIQSKVVDVIARRKILIIRLEKRLESKDYEKARKVLDELKATPDYDGMAEQLEAIQRIVFEDADKLTTIDRRKIDQLFNVTRVMLQKFLQDPKARQLELELIEIERKLPKKPAETESA